MQIDQPRLDEDLPIRSPVKGEADLLASALPEDDSFAPLRDCSGPRRPSL
jgi:hypothetical protein